MPKLKEWVQSSLPIPPENMANLERLRVNLKISHAKWNEQELVYKFIAPFISLVDFADPSFETFEERSIKAYLKNYELTGVVDFVAAKGIAKPQKPYFFLHEYKKFKGSEADPLGQVLCAMLAAQTLNADGKPIYGCYVFGPLWAFVLLDNDQYAVSEYFDVSTPHELQKVWSILQETKRRVIERARLD